MALGEELMLREPVIHDPDTSEAVKLLVSLAAYEAALIAVDHSLRSPISVSRDKMAKVLVYSSTIFWLTYKSPDYGDKFKSFSMWSNLQHMAHQFKKQFGQFPEKSTVELLVGFPES